MSSSGVRGGAIPQLRIRDLKAIDKYSIYKINVYPKSKLSAYITYCSSECRKEIDSYIEYRKRFGERITNESPLFRRDYNAHGNLVREVRSITRATIMRFMNKLVRDVGLRNIPLENQGYKRSEIMLSHGFRKFFETNATEVYALSDNHASEQGKLKDLEDNLHQKNYVKLDKHFEGSFDKEVLIQALKDILEVEGHSFNDPEIQNVRQYLTSNESKAYDILTSAYQRETKTEDKLSKVLLGKSIANILSKKKEYLEKSEPEKLLKRIHNEVNERMKSDLR
jgi:hypothetical protein